MKFDRDFFTSPTGQVVLVAAVLGLGVVAVRSQHSSRAAAVPPAPKAAPSVPLPKLITRDGARFPKPPAVSSVSVLAPTSAAMPTPPAVTRTIPLGLFSSPPEKPTAVVAPFAPFGRLIACETVVALESNHLETPIVGLVTEDVWHAGHLIIPAGAEVHGRARLDQSRERIGAQSSWHIVWRTTDADNGNELNTEGIILERELDPAGGTRGEHDGSAGLRGQVVRTDNDRELKLFAATFLSTATAALQETRPTVGLLGESSAPTATARNATLAGTSAILRDYAQELRAAIARDGFYLRVPAGHAFYLYATEILDRSKDSRGPTTLHAAAPSRP